MGVGKQTPSSTAAAKRNGNGAPSSNGSNGNHVDSNGLAKLTPPRGYRKEDSALRREWLAKRTGSSISSGVFDEPEKLQGLIENHVGYVGVPMSIAGPLKIDGSFAKGDFYVPLCTVEGTLSFSMTRGAYLDEADRAVEIVAQAVAVAPVDRQREADQAEHQQRAPRQRGPDREPGGAPQPQRLGRLRSPRRAPHRRNGARSASVLRIVVAATPASPIAWLIWSSPFTTSPAAKSPGTEVRW